MTAQAIKLKVTASVPKECVFQLEDDGWNGVCQELLLFVLRLGFLQYGNVGVGVFPEGEKKLLKLGSGRIAIVGSQVGLAANVRGINCAAVSGRRSLEFVGRGGLELARLSATSMGTVIRCPY